jgi:hypothetical protein
LAEGGFVEENVIKGIEELLDARVMRFSDAELNLLNIPFESDFL